MVKNVTLMHIAVAPLHRQSLGLHLPLTHELSRHDGAVGSQGDTMLAQPCPDALLQEVLLQVQAQWPEGSKQEVQPETHKDTGVAVPIGTTRGRWGRRGVRLCGNLPESSRTFQNLLVPTKLHLPK
jgi:hypothetical protein